VSQLLRAAIYVVLCYFFLALFSACAKVATQTVSPFTVLFFQNSLCFLFNLPQAIKEGVRTQQPLLHLVRDVTGFASYFLFIFAVKYIPLANAVVLNNSAPLWIPFVIWIWFKKKVPPYLWLSLIIGFIGIVFVLKPGAQFFDTASIYATVSGIFLAIAMVCIRRLTHTEPSSRILFYYFLVGTVISFPLAVKEIPSALKPPVLYFLLGSVVFFYLVQFFVNLGFKRGKASTLSPLAYTTILFSVILDRIFWNKVPDVWSWIGIFLIIAAGIASIYFEKKYEGKYV
jgi:drug/metabolite transporter (DMT)-like permease